MIRYSQILTLVLAALSANISHAQTDRPNILYFYADDMGWGAIGPNGQAERNASGLPSVLTPNLDKLAAAGVNFTRSYGCTVCSPARSSQQSGFHQGHTFADRNDPDNAKKAMRSDEVLIGDVLSAAGYVTGYWGKWGYGGSKSQRMPVIENIQTLPTSHGYQHVVAELHHVRAHTFFQPTLWTAPVAPGAVGAIELSPNSMAKYIGNSAYPDTPAMQNHPDYPSTAYCDDVYAFAALDFVRVQSQNYNTTGQPFFGLLALQVPHAPFAEISQLPEWNKAYRENALFDSLSEQTKQWAAMVTRLDAHFGNILDALEDPNGDGDTSDSVAADTLVIFQSDNGGPRHPARNELNANGGLRGNKTTIFEGGIRIPTVIRWPRKITANSTLKAGSSSSYVIDVTDLLPTFCELAEAPTPAGVDGVSLAPTLLGKGHQRSREFLIHEAGNYQSIIRGWHKLIRSKRGLELYDLKTDRAEANDIAAVKPAMVRKLETLLLGERVAEPKGFANTYHHWTGEGGTATSDPANWSDYVYANAGITYITDDGAPSLSWTALMENTGSAESLAKADADLEFLSLEIRGNPGASAQQILTLGPGVKLTGRNEIRLSSFATLNVDGGTVSTLRWIDVKPRATLKGAGAINAILYNQGTVSITPSSNSEQQNFLVSSNYHEYENSTFEVTVSGNNNTRLEVGGEAALAGFLVVTTSPGFVSTPGKTFTILTAQKINGTFVNPRHQVVSKSGALFEISYTNSAVTLTSL